MPRLFELAEGATSVSLDAATWALSVEGLVDSVSFAGWVSATGASVAIFATPASADLLLLVDCDGAASGRAKDEAIMAGSTGAPGTVG
jgi:hypothetical protein